MNFDKTLAMYWSTGSKDDIDNLYLLHGAVDSDCKQRLALTYQLLGLGANPNKHIGSVEQAVATGISIARPVQPLEIAFFSRRNRKKRFSQFVCVLRALLACGADPNATDVWGNTLADWIVNIDISCDYFTAEQLDMVLCLLLRAGAVYPEFAHDGNSEYSRAAILRFQKNGCRAPRFDSTATIRCAAEIPKKITLRKSAD